MKYILLTIAIIHITIFNVNAQFENVWAFGHNAGLDFNSGSPVAIKTSFDGFGEASASVCDSNGRLLFYTEGSIVWDRNGFIMPNGENLTPIKGFSDFTATASTTQGSIIIPMPDQEQKYYIFSLTSIEQARNAGRLYYSIIDMNLNGGMGDVILGQKGILLDSGLTEKMIGIVGNHCNVYLLVHALYSNTFKAWEITASGINIDPIISNVGNFKSYDASALKASHDGKKLTAIAIPFGGQPGLELFDFDQFTGKVSNPILLDSATSYYGAEFSPDNSKLYVSGYDNNGSNAGDGGAYYQFDLAASNPTASKTLIGRNQWGAALKLGPNGKIYFVSSVGSLGVINAPNLIGTACNFIPDEIQLSGETEAKLGLPNIVPVIKRGAIYSHQTVKGGCFPNENSLSLQANNDTTGWDFIWSNGSYSPYLEADTPGIYWISYHSPPCIFNVDTFEVQFPNGVLPKIETKPSCQNNRNGRAYAYTYVQDTVTYHYIWRDDFNSILSVTDTLKNAPSGNYTLQVTTANCDTTLSFFISEEEYKVSFLVDSIVCEGEELIFQNTSDDHFNQFRWDFGDRDHSSVQNPTHIYNQSGVYEITLIGTGEICMDTTFQIVIVDSLIFSNFLIDTDSICVGESIIFIPQIKSNTITSMNWLFGDGASMFSKDHRIQHAYDIKGILPVSLNTHFRACPGNSFTDTIYVFDLPKVNLGTDYSICLDAEPIYLKNLQLESEGLFHYSWNTGAETEILKVTHPGTYSLTVSEMPLGCSSTESITITKDCYIDIPNAFTPDGDGINDYFFPRQLLSKNVTAFSMKILNRWGQLIYETTTPNGRRWDGKFNGREQPAGVYVYIIVVEIDGNRNEVYEGNVTLLR